MLVIGSGGSGLRAAIQVAEHGADVLMVGKRPAIDAHTTLAAGGMFGSPFDPVALWQASYIPMTSLVRTRLA